MQLTYFWQSSFTVSLGRTLLVFSYHQTGVTNLPEDKRLTDKAFQGYTNIVVFVPDASAEHCDPAIFDWKRSFPITYAMNRHAAKNAPKTADVRACREGDVFSVGNCDVRVFASIGNGVCFLATVGGVRIFHAGDLNLWHWRDENSLKEIARAEAEFYEKAAKLPRDGIDLCLFPLDPNQGGLYDAGANHVIMRLRPRLFVPMHFGARTEIAQEYARRALSRRTSVFALTAPGEAAAVDFSGEPPQVRIVSPARAERLRHGSRVNLSAYGHEDPFSQTDLPVDIREGKKE